MNSPINHTETTSSIEGESKKKSSFWDIVVLFLIVTVVLGFWWYYRSTKQEALAGFEQADKLYIEKNYQKALEMYEELKNSDYLEPVHDSILSQRLDTLYEVLNL